MDNNIEIINKLEKRVSLLERVIFYNLPNAPSSQQLKVIGYIEENLGIEFEGYDREDATQFIKENMEKSKEKHKSIKQETEGNELTINKSSDFKEEINKNV